MADDKVFRISVGLNTDTAIKDAQKLGAEVQATLNKMDMGNLDSKTLSFIKNLTTASNRSQKLARDLQAFGETKISTEAYKNLADELKAAKKEADALIKKQDKMREKAGIGDSDSYANIQQKLADQGKEFNESWNNVETKIQEAHEDIKRVETQMEQLVASGKAFTLGKDTEKYKDMANNLNTANQATNILLEKYSEMTQANEQMSQANEQVSQSNEEMAQADEQVSQGNEEVAESTEKATKATKRYGKTLRDVGKTIISSLKNAINKLVKAFKSLSKHLLSSNKGHNSLGKSLKSNLSTVLRYTLGIRSIFMLVRRLRSTVAEAFKVMAQEIHEVNEAISTLGTSFKQLKATSGTMFQPLLQALAPILNTVIQKVTSLMNAIARFFATLTGQDYVYEATVANYDYADSVKEAEKANEGALASFDKLNVIAKDSADNSNTLGLTKDTVTYKKVDINPEDNWYTKLAKKIVEGWAKADLSEATHYIAEALANMLDSVKWEDIRGKTTKFAHTIATGINGITLPDEATGKSHLAISIGNTIAEALQTAIDTFDTFITDINWTNLGKFIATAIESLKDKLRNNASWRKAGAAFGHLFQGLVKLGLELLVNDNVFAGLGTDLSEFINSVIAEGMKINPNTGNTFIKDFGIALSTGFVNLLKEIEAFLDGSSNDLAEAVNELFLGIDLFEIAKHMAIVFIKGLKTGLKLLLSAGLGALGITVDGDTAEFLAEALGIGLLGAKIAKLIKKITGSDGLLSAFSKKDKALNNQRKALGLETVAVTALGTALVGMGGNALTSATDINTLTDSVKNAQTGIDDIAVPSLDRLAQGIDNVAEAGKTAATELQQSTSEAITNMENQFEAFTPTINAVDTSTYSTAISATQQTITTLENMWANAKLKAPAPTYETPEGTKSTSGSPAASPTTSGAPYQDLIDHSVKVTKNLNDQQQVTTDKSTVKDTSTGTSTSKSTGSVQGAPYQNLISHSTEVTAEQRQVTIDKNVKKFEEMCLEGLSESEQAIIAKLLNDHAQLIGYTDLNQIWSSDRNTTQAINSVTGKFSEIKNGKAAVSKDYTDSLIKGLENFLRWLPMAGTGFGLPIPFLARGAVIPANQPFMAVLGDQKSGTNIEAPLKTIEQAVANVLSQIKIKAVFDVNGDPNGLFRVIQKQAEIHYNRHGNNGLSGEG